MFPGLSTPVLNVQRDSAEQTTILFDNGLSVQISILNVTQISWMVLNIKLLNGLSDIYSNKLVGLMGNLNEITADDIMSRNGAMPANVSLESSIYPIAMNCKLNFKIYS
jgi:hypothetical protein